jgi:hypothetical protein
MVSLERVMSDNASEFRSATFKPPSPPSAPGTPSSNWQAAGERVRDRTS